jgi:hypothetical protein
MKQEMINLISKMKEFPENKKLGYFIVIVNDDGLMCIQHNVCPLCTITNLLKWAITNQIKHDEQSEIMH